MILYDPRDGNKPRIKGELSTSEILVSHTRKMGVESDRTLIPSGDAFFTGNGPSGEIGIVVERKTISDMLSCIRNGHFTEQRVNMTSGQYAVSILILEGIWRPHNENDYLMTVYPNGQWGYASFGGHKARYSELFRFLIGVQISGVFVVQSNNLWHTAYNIAEIYHYFQKKWDAHKSLKQLYRPTLGSMRFDTIARRFKASVTQQWAAALDGVGVDRSQEADRYFKTPFRLATSEEQDWLKIGNIGAPTAIKIVRQINGWE